TAGRGALTQWPLREGPVDCDWQRVVRAPGARAPIVDGVATRHGKVLARGVTEAWLTVVDVQVGVTAVRAGSDIGHFGDDVPGQLAFVSNVVLLDDCPIKTLARAWESFGTEVWRAHEDSSRQQHFAGFEIRDRYSRDAGSQGSDREELIGGGVKVDVIRERAPQRARPGQRIDGAAIADAHHLLLTQAVRHAQARREVPGLEFEADVFRHAAATAQQHGVRAVVEPFDTAISAVHERVILEP